MRPKGLQNRPKGEGRPASAEHPHHQSVSQIVAKELPGLHQVHICFFDIVRAPSSLILLVFRL